MKVHEIQAEIKDIENKRDLFHVINQLQHLMVVSTNKLHDMGEMQEWKMMSHLCNCYDVLCEAHGMKGGLQYGKKQTSL